MAKLDPLGQVQTLQWFSFKLEMSAEAAYLLSQDPLCFFAVLYRVYCGNFENSSSILVADWEQLTLKGLHQKVLSTSVFQRH